jgi:outer membrane murein-binding lipoprotein Lpp
MSAGNESGFWGAAVVVVLAAIGAISRWVSGKASKDDLTAAISRFDEHHALARDDIERMFEEMKADREDASRARHDMRDKMQSIALTVARLEGKIDNGGHI